jgi:hypothetical protein
LENDYYVARGGFSGSNLVSMAMSKVYPSVSNAGWLTRDNPLMHTRTKDYLARSIPVPARVDFNPATGQWEQHWILLVGWDGIDYLMNDPWTGAKAVRVSDYYNISGSDVLECIYYFLDDIEPEPPPTGEQVNVGSYMQAHPAAWRVVYNIKPDGTRQGQDVQDMSLGNGVFVRSKSSNGTSAEWWKLDGNYAYLIADTSPAPDTMYTIAKNGTVGNSPKNPVYMYLGEYWQESGSHFVQFKYKNGCANITQPPTGTNVNTAKLLWRNQSYQFPKMPVTLDVIALLTTNGETQLYAKTNQQSASHYAVPVGLSIGWCGWFAEWGRAELEELYWNRGQLTKEPNRYCGW